MESVAGQADDRQGIRVGSEEKKRVVMDMTLVDPNNPNQLLFLEKHKRTLRKGKMNMFHFLFDESKDVPALFKRWCKSFQQICFQKLLNDCDTLEEATKEMEKVEAFLNRVIASVDEEGLIAKVKEFAPFPEYDFRAPAERVTAKREELELIPLQDGIFSLDETIDLAKRVTVDGDREAIKTVGSWVMRQKRFSETTREKGCSEQAYQTIVGTPRTAQLYSRPFCIQVFQFADNRYQLRKVSGSGEPVRLYRKEINGKAHYDLLLAASSKV